MNESRELERHNGVLNKIEMASKKEDIPKIVKSNITSFLATNAYLSSKKISTNKFVELTDLIVSKNTFNDKEVKEMFINILRKEYEDINIDLIEILYDKINKTNRIDYLLEEISKREKKIKELERKEEINDDNKIMNMIDNANEISELPKVTRSILTSSLISPTETEYNKRFITDDVREIASLLIEGHKLNSPEIEHKLLEVCMSKSSENAIKIYNHVMNIWTSRERLYDLAEEIAACEKKTKVINKWEHERIMDQIKEARRISHLPPDRSYASLTSTLSGNSTIYTNGGTLKVEEFKTLANLLIEGNKIDSDKCIEEIKNITKKNYPEDENAWKLLLDKFSKLEKLPYLVEEVTYFVKRQTEFIGRSCSNVNVYFVPNNKTPEKGGRFYNCYINRVDNLDLGEILPLNLDEIVPKGMDVDVIEWYVQENYDETFKTAGGIILNLDEDIGNVNVFRPNDGKVGITQEEKQKLDKLEDLDKQIEEKEAKILSLDEQLNLKQQKFLEVDQQMKTVVSNYEQKALALQLELLRSIQEIKESMNSSIEEPKGKVRGK